jgi:glycosyltransferase involved in cell wall biosynthesis
MKSKKKVLLIGPLPKPIHGMSICNELIVKDRSFLKIGFIDTANKSFSEDLGKLRFQKIISAIKPYFKIYKIFKADIVYLTPGQTFYGVLKNAPFLLLSKILKKESVIHIHGNFLKTQYDQLEGLKKIVFKKTLELASKGIVLSESLIPNLTPFLQKEHIFVLYNFVEQMLLDVSEKEIINKDISELKIIFLSNLMTEKGIFDLLEALKILDSKKIKFEANIAGNIDVKIKSKVLNIIHKLPNTKYVGVVRGDEKKKLLMQANVFVFPTFYKMEGQPISILESMATGNIVFTTKHAGIPDVFSEKNGFYIEKRSPNDIANKLQKLNNELLNYKKIMLYNHNYVKKNFTPFKFLQRLSKILEE